MRGKGRDEIYTLYAASLCSRIALFDRARDRKFDMIACVLQ